MRKSKIRLWIMLACMVLLPAIFIADLLLKAKYGLNSYQNVCIGDPIDNLDSVFVYYNGSVGHVEGRNLTDDGYNLGLKYQCVEFVKRYYYERYGHKMPDSYGHAKSFYDPAVPDGGINAARGLRQYKNGGIGQPEVGDLVVFSETIFNKYGHVAIISEVQEEWVEIIQQNAGILNHSRARLPLKDGPDGLYIDDGDVRGWLRMID